MASKWADGIRPRDFRWIIKDRLGVSERPGGYGAGHRRVRRQEEIVWLCQSKIDLIVTLTPIPYNLHDYDEYGLPYVHLPFPDPIAGADRLEEILTTIHERSAVECLLLHHDSLGDPIGGVIAAYLLWTGLVDSAPNAIVVVERLLERELGPAARETVNMAEELKPRTSAPQT